MAILTQNQLVDAVAENTGEDRGVAAYVLAGFFDVMLAENSDQSLALFYTGLKDAERRRRVNAERSAECGRND